MKTSHRILSALCFLCILLSSGYGQLQRRYALTDTLSISPDILTGTLANSLRYYIRENKKPERRMELRLVVKTGSVMEDDDQQGLAHFVEHMAFNGTKSFPKADLVNFLERTGVRFGPHLNAYTSFDETVYMIQVPTDSTVVVEKSFKILEEWASAQLFDHQEIDKERGVVGEEWRLGRGAFERVQNKHYPTIYYNSQYAKRLPIGKKEILDNAPYDALKRFYRDWYRPDLMAVVLVGDFDKKTMEAKVKEHFSGLTNPHNERPRTKYLLSEHETTLISVATDKELPHAGVSIRFKRNRIPELTVADYRRRILNNLYDGMLNERFQELLQKPNPPFVFVSAGNSNMVGEKQAYGLFASVKENEVLRGIEALLTEAFRVKQHGFTQTELDRQKAQSLRYIEQAYLEREKTESFYHADEYIRNFLQGEPIPGIAAESEIYKQFIPGITLAEVNALTAERITEGNRIVTVSAPEKEGVVIPSEQEILNLFKEISTKKLDPYVDVVSTKPLVASMPKPGKVSSEKELKDLGAWEWKLSNGARVVLKTTDFKNDEILFSAWSPGGHSLVADKDFVSASFASALASQSGVGEFDAITLQKMLAAKIVYVSPAVTELSEGFSGSSSAQDLETLFELVYLNFTSPRHDTSAAGAFLTRMKASLQNMKASPEAAFDDTVRVTLSNYHFRGRPQSPQLIEEVSPLRAYTVFKNRFADASDFVFFFVGNFRIETIRPLVERYLASLPSIKRKESWKDIGMKAPKGSIEKTVVKGVEPKSLVQLVFTGEFRWNDENRFDFNAMLEVLRIKLREVLREDKGGVYGVGVSGSPSKYPRQEYTIRINFGCNPDRVDELVRAVMEQIESLKPTPTPDEYVGKVKELQRRDHEVNLKRNSWWMTVFRTYYSNGEDPSVILKTPERIDTLIGMAIQSAAKKYFDKKNIAKVVLRPEKTTP